MAAVRGLGGGPSVGWPARRADADPRAGSTEMIDLEVPDEDNVENKTTGEPEDTSSARLVRKRGRGADGV